jgi:2',3'-cyclic-nucleotide 2'-phosphodiesterase (5'-nucleotidase family)
VNASRATIPRIVIVNTGSIRFDLVKGPFTYDDSFIVSPFTDAFQYINVPYALAKSVLNSLNGAGGNDKKRNSAGSDWGFEYMPQVKDSCLDPTISLITGEKGELKARGHTRRQTVVTPGYTTTE